MFERRQILLGAAAALTMPRIAFAKAETERRLVFLIQRGAADGLATLAPTGDPAYASLRGDLAAELMNTGLEEAIDYISKADDPRAKKAKDCGSAAVALTALAGGVAWVVILIG